MSPVTNCMQQNQQVKLSMASLHIHTYCLIIVLLITFYDFYNSSKTLVVQIKNPKFSLNGPFNATVIKTNDVYENLINIKNFSFTKNPQPCDDYPAGFLLLIIVTSNPVNHVNRMIIRNSWGKNVESTRTLYMVGESYNATINKQIELESKQYGDIVQGTFTDAYRNMTYKHVMGLKWAAHHCSNAKYVLKADDDIVVNSRELRRFLSKNLSPWGARGLIACNVLRQVKAWRSGKWKVTEEEYSSIYYPNYCAGWVILYSQDVIVQLLEEAQRTPYFWIDDVQITGIVAEQLGLARSSLRSLIMTLTQEHILLTLGPKYTRHFLFGPAEMDVDKMQRFWKAIPA